MMNVSIRKMRVFMAALEQQSFTKAAMVQNISQPAATIIINQIEQEFECQLFDRNGSIRRPIATEKGKEVAETFSKILSTYDGELALVRSLSQGKRQKSRILIQTSFDIALSTRWLSGLIENYIDSELSLEVMPRGEILDQVGNRQATLGLIDGVTDESKLDFAPVGGFELVLAVPRANTSLGIAWDEIDWDNLPDKLLYFNNLNPALARQLSRKLESAGENAPRVITVNSMTSMISLMQKQNWPALIPDAMLSYANAHVPCRSIPFKNVSLSSQFCLVTPWGHLNRIPRSITRVKNCFHSLDELM